MSSNANIVLTEVEEDLFFAATRALHWTAEEGLNFAKTFTGGSRPPAKKGEGLRKERRGGWSDVTGNLINSFAASYPVRKGSSIMADIFTDRDYADKLDGRARADGGMYYVLTGLDEDFDFESTFDDKLSEAMR